MLALILVSLSAGGAAWWYAPWKNPPAVPRDRVEPDLSQIYISEPTIEFASFTSHANSRNNDSSPTPQDSNESNAKPPVDESDAPFVDLLDDFIDYDVGHRAGFAGGHGSHATQLSFESSSKGRRNGGAPASGARGSSRSHANEHDDEQGDQHDEHSTDPEEPKDTSNPPNDPIDTEDGHNGEPPLVDPNVADHPPGNGGGCIVCDIPDLPQNPQPNYPPLPEPHNPSPEPAPVPEPGSNPPNEPIDTEDGQDGEPPLVDSNIPDHPPGNGGDCIVCDIPDLPQNPQPNYPPLPGPQNPSPEPVPVPEPGTLGLMLLGVLGAAAARRRSARY
jgi:hypothetical protein